MNTVKLVTASTEEPVTRLEAKLWLRIDEHEPAEDPLIDSLLTRARQRWEEVTHRCPLIQTYDYYMDRLPNRSDAIDLPRAPLVAVTSIRGFQTTDYDDAMGLSMSTSGYYVDTASEFGRVKPHSTFTYPVSTREINGGIVRFTAGYSTAASGVPESVKTEIKQLVARLYEHRGDEVEQAQVLATYGCIPTELDLPTWG